MKDLEPTSISQDNSDDYERQKQRLSECSRFSPLMILLRYIDDVRTKKEKGVIDEDHLNRSTASYCKTYLEDFSDEFDPQIVGLKLSDGRIVCKDGIDKNNLAQDQKIATERELREAVNNFKIQYGYP